MGRGAERGCTVEGEEKKNQKGLFGLILAGRRRMMSSGLGEPKPWGGGSFVRDRFSFRFRVLFFVFF